MTFWDRVLCAIGLHGIRETQFEWVVTNGSKASVTATLEQCTICKQIWKRNVQ